MNNGSWEILLNGRYIGLISQNPNSVNAAKAGKWVAVINLKDDSSRTFGYYNTAATAKSDAESKVKLLMRQGLL